MKNNKNTKKQSMNQSSLTPLTGSSNIDLRSFDLNYENNLLLQDKNLTQAINER